MSAENLPADSVRYEAQRTSTDAYLDAGLIKPEQLNQDGLYVDEYADRSEFIHVPIGEKQTAIRMIHADKKGGILSLPTLNHFSVDPTVVRDTAHAVRLSEITPKKVVEISGLGSIKANTGGTTSEVFDATRQAYAQALRRSLDQGHDLWVMNVDRKLKNHLEMILGDHHIKQLGEERDYMSPPTVPIALNPQDVVASILKGEDSPRFAESNLQDIQASMQGVSEKFLSPKMVKALHDHDIETEKTSPLVRAWQNKRIGGYAIMVLYSAVRFVPLSFVNEFDGSVALFAGIDIGTAVTQAGSMELFFKGKNRAQRMLGVVGTAASFIAPYAYVGATNAHGSPFDYPPYVYAVAGGFAAIGVGLEVSRSRADSKLKHGLQSSDIPSIDR